MKRITVLATCLVAVFALAAVAVSSASAAEPEWGHCVAKPKKGNYTEGNCQTVATKTKTVKKVKEEVPDHKGNFEWAPGAEAACYAQKDGNYTDSGCTKVAEKTTKGVKAPDHKGKYEKTGAGAFTSKSGPAILQADLDGCETREPEHNNMYECNIEGKPGPGEEFGNSGYLAVECSGETATGSATGSKEVTNVAVVFHECYNPNLGADCSSEGAAKEGEVKLEELKGELGYIEGKGTSHPKVGVLLEPAAAKGYFVKDFFCGNAAEKEESGEVLTVGEGNATQGHTYQEEKAGEGKGGHDGIISPITPVNQMTSTFTQEYTQTAAVSGKEAAENIPARFEGGQRELLETRDDFAENFYHDHEEFGITWSKASEVLTNTNTDTEGPGEIKG